MIIRYMGNSVLHEKFENKTVLNGWEISMSYRYIDIVMKKIAI